MKLFLHKGLPVYVVIMIIAVACATSIRTTNLWKDDTYNKKVESILVIAVAELDYMRDHFENVMALRLGERGIKAVASNTIFPATKKLDRQAVTAKIKELGIGSVLVGRSISKTEHSHLISGGYYVVPVSFTDGWYNSYADALVPLSVPGSAYDAEHFSMVVNLYESAGEKLVWSDLLKVKIEGSRQGAMNPFIGEVIKDMDSSGIIPGAR